MWCSFFATHLGALDQAFRCPSLVRWCRNCAVASSRWHSCDRYTITLLITQINDSSLGLLGWGTLAMGIMLLILDVTKYIFLWDYLCHCTALVKYQVLYTWWLFSIFSFFFIFPPPRSLGLQVIAWNRSHRARPDSHCFQHVIKVCSLHRLSPAFLSCVTLNEDCSPGRTCSSWHEPREAWPFASNVIGAVAVPEDKPFLGLGNRGSRGPSFPFGFAGPGSSTRRMCQAAPAFTWTVNTVPSGGSKMGNCKYTGHFCHQGGRAGDSKHSWTVCPLPSKSLSCRGIRKRDENKQNLIKKSPLAAFQLND